VILYNAAYNDNVYVVSITCASLSSHLSKFSWQSPIRGRSISHNSALSSATAPLPLVVVSSDCSCSNPSALDTLASSSSIRLEYLTFATMICANIQSQWQWQNLQSLDTYTAITGAAAGLRLTAKHKSKAALCMEC
jgi:hypothetical protein